MLIDKQVATLLLFDRNRRLLVYLRDNNPRIPFPNHWDLFGGHIEAGETPEVALVREVQEELGIELIDYKFFRRYVCTEGDVTPNIKHVFWAVVDAVPEELELYEGQKLKSIEEEERKNLRFANILGKIVDDFVESGLWPPKQ